ILTSLSRSVVSVPPWIACGSANCRRRLCRVPRVAHLMARAEEAPCVSPAQVRFSWGPHLGKRTLSPELPLLQGLEKGRSVGTRQEFRVTGPNVSWRQRHQRVWIAWRWPPIHTPYPPRHGPPDTKRHPAGVGERGERLERLSSRCSGCATA